MRNHLHALRVEPEQPENPAVHAFLFAQLQWERYHATRLFLVHAIALGGLCLWTVLALGTMLPNALRAAVLAAWGLCFLLAAFAAMMERYWSQRRDRSIAGIGKERRSV